MINVKERKIIVSCDDFGISPIANRNIFELLIEGKIDRIGVMMSDYITEKQVSDLKSSGAKIDIHLNLDSHNIDKWQKEQRIIERGIVKRATMFVYNYFFWRGKPKKVMNEWKRQIENFIDVFGFIPDGITSHEHIHFFPPYFKIAIRLAEKYKISYMRFGRKNIHGASNGVSFILNYLRKKNIRCFRETEIQTSDYLVSFDWFHELSFANNLPKDCLIETVFHPELPDEHDFIFKQ